MTRRMASKMMPPTWNMNPIMTNLISPKEAMMTPTTIMETFPSVLRLGAEAPRPQVAKRTATGVVACQWSVLGSTVAASRTYLEHLDEGNTEVQIRLVTADQRQTEEDADGNNGS